MPVEVHGHVDAAMPELLPKIIGTRSGGGGTHMWGEGR